MVKTITMVSPLTDLIGAVMQGNLSYEVAWQDLKDHMRRVRRGGRIRLLDWSHSLLW